MKFARHFEICGGIALGKRPAQRRPAVRHEFVRLFAQTAAIHHRLVSRWARGGVVAADADLALELDGGRHVEMPVTTVCWFRGDRIARCEFSFYPEAALPAA